MFGTASLVRVSRQVIVAVGGDAVVLLARFLHGVYVDHGFVEVDELVQEMVVDLPGYRVPLRYGQLRRDRYVDLGTQPVPEPARPDLSHVLDAFDVARGVPDLVQHLGVHPVEEASKDDLAGLPDDHEDRRGDKETHDRVGERKAKQTPTAPIRTARLVHPSVLAW